MARPDDVLLGQRAAQESFESRMAPQRRTVMVGNTLIDATPYIGMRYPGEDVTKMLGDPASILKEPKIGARYVWRKPDDRFTRSMVRRQIMRPVTIEEVDSSSPYANVDTRKLQTERGPKEVVENIGLGLFEMANAQAQREFDDWEKYYISGLVELSDKWQAEVEKLSHSSMTANASGYPVAVENSAIEAI